MTIGPNPPNVRVLSARGRLQLQRQVLTGAGSIPCTMTVAESTSAGDFDAVGAAHVGSDRGDPGAGQIRGNARTLPASALPMRSRRPRSRTPDLACRPTGSAPRTRPASPGGCPGGERGWVRYGSGNCNRASDTVRCNLRVCCRRCGPIALGAEPLCYAGEWTGAVLAVLPHLSNRAWHRLHDETLPAALMRPR